MWSRDARRLLVPLLLLAAPAAVAVEDYPKRPRPDAATLARGKTLYDVACAFCHGPDARGGEQGPNLLRSEIVLADKAGELIAPVVLNGRPDKGMPQMPLAMAQIKDVSAYVHSFPVGGYDVSRVRPPSIVVGDAAAGKAYFTATCARCHSVAGDLAGIGRKITDAKVLQQTWLMPKRGEGAPAAIKVAPITVTVTLPGGRRVQGELGRIDDFIVTLTNADGTVRSFRRRGDNPRVELRDPLEPHRELLPRYTDKDIHDVTAYLVTVK